MKGVSELQNTLFQFSPKKNPINSRVKRSDDNKSLVEATAKNNYKYCLNQEDMIEIVRLEYKNYRSDKFYTMFKIINSLDDLQKIIKFFLKKRKNSKNKRLGMRFTLMLYHAPFNVWATLVIYGNESYIRGFYADTFARLLDQEFELFFQKNKIEIVNLTQLSQAKEIHNSGLWALEYAADINRMIEYNRDIVWAQSQLNQQRNKDYFDSRRRFLTDKLFSDFHWRACHPNILDGINLKREMSVPHSSTSLNDGIDSEPPVKRIKNKFENEQVNDLLKIFTENFISDFMKRLIAYHIISRGERLTEQAVKNELKTGLMDALLSIGITQSVFGGAPSFAMSVKAITEKYFLNKATAQKVTKFFSLIKEENLLPILADAGVNIFYSFEYQFMHVSDQAGNAVAMEKLANDAVGRVVNYIKKLDFNNEILINKELIEKAVIYGQSEKYFDPSLRFKPKPIRLRIQGNSILDTQGNLLNTAKLYDKVGLITFDAHDLANKLYESHDYQQKYGYRRLFNWEKDENGDLNDSLQEKYTQKPLIHPGYEYVLKTRMLETEAQKILDKIQNRFPAEASNIAGKKATNKPPIYFNLREPVADFTGRVEILKQVHATLLSEKKMGVVSALSTLSIASTSAAASQIASSGSQLSISGLGGIGKTQLALQYAKLYAKDYDHNVLWINAETKENLSFSFTKLARKLRIETKDHYNQDKNLIEIVEAIYEYFLDRKSLFILDNAENYREIEAYLPKSMLGNKPTILITSRYSNWNNVATVILLDVFSNDETIKFFKKSLGKDSQENSIKILNQLLQGLPLALKQAIAYINLRRESNPNFSINDYIELYKEKTQLLLDFNFSAYSNDPYLKTVFTTFLVSLSKIKTHPILGKHAAEILYVSAYLDPDNLSNELFYLLDIFNISDRTASISYVNELIHFLKSYSIINPGFEPGKYTIHRLVQQVLRINLEKDPATYEKIIKATRSLVQHIKKEEEFHFLHFLLYISENELAKSVLKFDSIQQLFNSLAKKEINYWVYFLDLAYQKFPKNKYFEFLGDSLAYCRKEGFIFLVGETFHYIQDQLETGKFSKEEIYKTFERIEFSKETTYRINRYSSDPAKKQRQKSSVKLIYDTKKSIFGSYENYLFCRFNPKRKKRSLCVVEEKEEALAKYKLTAIKRHLEKVSTVNHFINTGLMSKTILSAMIRGDWDEVAVNFELICSSQILEKISISLLAEGTRLEKEAGFLGKKLEFEIQKVGMLFVNKQIPLATKKLLLARSFQVASSFVGRGTGAYFAYTLVKQLQAYRAGATELLPEIIFNGVATGTTIIEIGSESLEFFGYLMGATELNPLLGFATALVWLGTELYEAEEQEEAIEKFIHLSSDEKFIEFVRGFLKFPPSEYLQIKLKNTHLVQYAMDFLKNHTDFSSYIVPDFSPAGVLYADNRVYLDKKREVTPVETSPDAPEGGELFCLSGNLTQNYQQAYLCQYAMGIQTTQDRTGNASLINLEAGNDTVLAFVDTPNYFFVGDGDKRYQGGHKGNVFTLVGNATRGQLRGGEAADVLLLERYNPESDYLLLDSHGYLCGDFHKAIQTVPLFCEEEPKLELVEINQIYGRKQQQDIIYLNQAIQYIDGYGGSSPEHPDIFFIRQEANENLSLVLRNNTLVVFRPNALNNLTADYQIPDNEMGQATIQLDFNQEIQHRFFFGNALEDILAIDLQNNTLILSVYAENGFDSGNFTLRVLDSNFNANQGNNVTHFERKSSYFFQNIEIKLINNDQLFVQEVSNNTQRIEDYNDRFSPLANYLGRTITIQLPNATLALGRGEHEIFYADGSLATHLVGNGGENIYRIIPPSPAQFPLEEITVYASSSSWDTEQIDTLDLSEVYKQINTLCPNAEFHLVLIADKEDLILILSSDSIEANHCNRERYGRVLTVCLKSGIYWYQNLDVILKEAIPKHIDTQDGEDWRLIDNPLVFAEDKHVIMLNDKGLGESTEISLLRNSGNYSFFRNASDLIMSNIHSNPWDPCTLVVYGYYRNAEMKNKVLSSKLSFFDEDFHFKDYQPLIDEAQSFSDFVKQLESGSDFKHHPPLAIPPILRLPRGELPKLRLKRQIPSMELKLAHHAKGWIPFVAFGLSATLLATAGVFYRIYKRQRSSAPILVAAGLSSLPTVSANQQKIATEKSALDFFSEFSIEKNCLSAVTAIGWLAVCQNKRSIIFLKNKNYPNSCCYYFESYELNKLNNAIAFQRVETGVWEPDVCEITTNESPENIYSLLPPDWQQLIIEEKTQQQLWTVWKHCVLMTTTSTLVDKLFLCTRVGNILKTFNLAPDWQSREDRYLLSRCGFAIEQQLFHTNRPSNLLLLGSISAEFVLLHPASHRVYQNLIQQEDFSKAKFIVRFLLDVLQLGFYNICHLAHVLEYYFPGNEFIRNISLGLRMSNYFYFLTGDLSYWHLGLALFFIPQIPMFLDHLGVPATRSIHCFCNKLANWLLGQALLESLTEDEQRQNQAEHELRLSDMWVKQGEIRLSAMLSALDVNFFPKRKIINLSPANDKIKEKKFFSL